MAGEVESVYVRPVAAWSGVARVQARLWPCCGLGRPRGGPGTTASSARSPSANQRRTARACDARHLHELQVQPPEAAWQPARCAPAWSSPPESAVQPPSGSQAQADRRSEVPQSAGTGRRSGRSWPARLSLRARSRTLASVVSQRVMRVWTVDRLTQRARRLSGAG